jgi:hypothetical protein
MNLLHLLHVMVSSFWFWADVILGVSGGAVVWWGLNVEKAGEKMLLPSDFNPDIFNDIVQAAKSKMDRGWFILKIGIIIEVVAALGISVISGLETAELTDQSAIANLEAKKAEREAGQANVLAANTESNNLVLKKDVLKLKQWRTITAEDKNNFIGLTANISKFPIRVRMAANATAEVEGFAIKVRDMLDAAGFVETNRDVALTHWPDGLNIFYTGGLPEMPSVMFINNLSQTSNIIDLQDAQLAMKSFPNYSSNSLVKTAIFIINDDSKQKAFISIFNGEPVMNIPVPSTGAFRMNAFMQVQAVFNEMGITTEWMFSTNIPKGACEVFIDPKF